MLQALIRNPLAFPCGVPPGIDTKHIAYSNLVRIAAICMNNAGTTTTGFGAQNGLIDLQTGLHGGSSNSIDEFGTDGGVGPFITSNAFRWIIWPSPLVAPDDKYGTIAVIVRIPDVAVFTGNTSYYEIFSNQQGKDGGISLCFGDTNGILFLNCPNSPNPFGYSSNGLAITSHTPYFIAVSYQPNGTAMWVVRNLANGSLQAAIVPQTPAMTLKTQVNPVYLVGSSVLGWEGSPTRVAALYWSGKCHGFYEMIKWSADPWSFWYPERKANNLFLPTASGITPPDTGLVGIRGLSHSQGY